MKIMICGSMTFAKEMIDIKRKLLYLGHSVFVPAGIESHLEDPSLIDNFEENYKHAIERDVLRQCFNLITKATPYLFYLILKTKLKAILGLLL